MDHPAGIDALRPIGRELVDDIAGVCILPTSQAAFPAELQRRTHASTFA
jgi:hypothetical protein